MTTHRISEKEPEFPCEMLSEITGIWDTFTAFPPPEFTERFTHWRPLPAARAQQERFNHLRAECGKRLITAEETREMFDLVTAGVLLQPTAPVGRPEQTPGHPSVWHEITDWQARMDAEHKERTHGKAAPVVDDPPLNIGDKPSAPSGQTPTPRRIDVTWRGERGEYGVSIPNWDGGTVVSADDYDKLLAQLTAAQATISNLRTERDQLAMQCGSNGALMADFLAQRATIERLEASLKTQNEKLSNAISTIQWSKEVTDDLRQHLADAEKDKARLEEQVKWMSNSRKTLAEWYEERANLRNRLTDSMKDNARLDLLDELVERGFGALELGLTEDGQTGIWAVGRDSKLGSGNDIRDAIDSLSPAPVPSAEKNRSGSL